jgi:hypothetical protein
MSEENVKVWRAQIERLRAAASGQLDQEDAICTMAEVWDPEIELDVSEAPALDLAGTRHGIGAVRQWWREWFAAWETLHFEYELVDAGADCVVMLLDLRMRGRSSGIEVPLGEHAWVTTFKDGLMVYPTAPHEPGRSPRRRRAA